MKTLNKNQKEIIFNLSPISDSAKDIFSKYTSENLFDLFYNKDGEGKGVNKARDFSIFHYLLRLNIFSEETISGLFAKLGESAKVRTFHCSDFLYRLEKDGNINLIIKYKNFFLSIAMTLL